jgi:hypothetical protein
MIDTLWYIESDWYVEIENWETYSLPNTSFLQNQLSHSSYEVDF